MFRRIFLLTLLALTAGVSMVSAQEREIYTVLAFGDDVFEPEIWLASAQEEVDRTTATWRADESFGVAYAEYLHVDVSEFDAEAYFNDEWFQTVFQNYDSWELVDHCNFENDTELRVFDMVYDDEPYLLNYWTWIADKDRVLAFFLVLPVDSEADFLEYSELFAPDAAFCLA